MTHAIDAQQLWQGFRTPGLIRFVSEETAYLSTSSDGPRCFATPGISPAILMHLFTARSNSVLLLKGCT